MLIKSIFTAILFLNLSNITLAKEVVTFKSVMQNLGKAMDSLNQGIFNENFKVIEKAASALANHPKPKSQLPIVASTLKDRIKKFKSFDKKVHSAAQTMVDLAKQKDLTGILKHHAIVVSNCVACHTQFRKELSAAIKKKE